LRARGKDMKTRGAQSRGAVGALPGPARSYQRCRRCPAASRRRSPYAGTSKRPKEKTMPVILWLLGVPLGIVVLLMLFHVI
jgi:hypothetical protein